MTPATDEVAMLFENLHLKKTTNDKSGVNTNPVGVNHCQLEHKAKVLFWVDIFGNMVFFSHNHVSFRFQGKGTFLGTWYLSHITTSALDSRY